MDVYVDIKDWVEKQCLSLIGGFSPPPHSEELGGGGGG